MSVDHSESSGIRILARRAAAGDRRAFEELYAHFRDHLRRFIDLRLDDRVRARVDPSDVLQETQIEVYQRLADYLERNPMPLRVWMRKTAQQHLHAFHDRHLRAAKRSVSREAIRPKQSSISLARRLVADDPSPSQQLSLQERQQHIALAVSQLRDDDREILLMRNIEDLSFAEIAASLEVNPELARQRYGRAMLRLQKQLREFDQGDHR